MRNRHKKVEINCHGHSCVFKCKTYQLLSRRYMYTWLVDNINVYFYIDNVLSCTLHHCLTIRSQKLKVIHLSRQPQKYKYSQQSILHSDIEQFNFGFPSSL